MSIHPVAQPQAQKTDLTAGILKRLAQIVISLAIQAVLLFLCAGRLDWGMAWAYIGIYLVVVCCNAVIMLRTNPELIVERAEPKENTKRWDKIISGFLTVAFLGILVVAGRDYRWAWSPQFDPAIQIGGLVVQGLGLVLSSWAMLSNPYFSTKVRIQDERGQKVSSAGPYHYIRHPGYDGWIVQSLAMPLMLGSFWALIPGSLSALLMILRTVLEDRMLLVELPGYRDYAARVRYRLLPGIW